MKLTQTQIYTLRRMLSGTHYQMNANERRAREKRFRDDVNAPSIPVLFRKGLVSYTDPQCVKKRGYYYSVSLTPEGRIAAKIL